MPITDERMTRFSITLSEGVDFVISCLDVMWGGEIFVPKIPSYRITDVANAIIPDAKLEIIGIRPGEKIHEEMITASDSINTIEYDNYFVIVPSIEVWNKKDFMRSSNAKEGKPCPDGFYYNSGINKHFLTVAELRKLIDEHL